MSITSFHNPGLIPIEAATVMGINVKEGENPIGRFGTGLKYTIASLLRCGHKITIWRGLERYDFVRESRAVRGKDFDFIRMCGPDGDQILGFTTHLGAHWEMWQVFREIYSNCLDEAGELVMGAAEPADGRTTITVEGEAFADAARDRDLYFLTGEPLHKGALVNIHRGPSSGLFYRGILVAKLPKSAVFTYNVTADTRLTEDRTLTGLSTVGAYVAHAIEHCSDRAILDLVLTAREQWEADLHYSDVGSAFAEATLDLFERRGAAAIIPSAVGPAEVWAQKEARVKAAELSGEEEEAIEEATDFLASIGYRITAPIIVAETLGPGVFGMAKRDTIYLARVTINRGGNFLIGTLLEEHLHVSQGFRDESRAFQDFLIDLVVKFARDAVKAGRPISVTPIPRRAPIASPSDLGDEIPF